jgi:hypothetical protein
MAVSRAKVGIAGLASALAFVAISSAAQDRQAPLPAARPTGPAGTAAAPVAPVWDNAPDR